MDRFQFVTKAKCASHDKQLYIVVAVTDSGDCEVWKGCQECSGSSRLLQTLVERGSDNKRL